MSDTEKKEIAKKIVKAVDECNDNYSAVEMVEDILDTLDDED